MHFCLHLCMFLTLAISGQCFLMPEGTPINLGAFNIKWFTVSKSNDTEVVKSLAQIIARYDLVLVTELRDDGSNVAVDRLWTQVNNTGVKFGMAISGRLGRYPNFYTEQYAFFYRPDRVTLVDKYQYDDMPGNEFEREPYAVLVKSPDSVNQRSTALIGSHIQPKNAVAEMIEMKTVVDDVKRHWWVDRVIVLGDLNADCSYMNAAERASTPLKSDPGFVWLIPDEADTTVSTNTDCAYDRIITTDNIHTDNTTVFLFDAYYGWTFEEAWDVSDHYPVETILYL